MTKHMTLEKRLTTILTNEVLDSIIHAIESDDLRWCGESPVLVEIAAPDAVLALIINWHLEAYL